MKLIIYIFYTVSCSDVRRILWIMSLWARDGASLLPSAGDARKNTISWTTHPLDLSAVKVGSSARHSITSVNSLFWRTLLFQWQGFSARSRHLYIEPCVRANMLKSFDLLKTQIQVILSEVIASFIVMQCVLPFGCCTWAICLQFLLLVPLGNSKMVYISLIVSWQTRRPQQTMVSWSRKQSCRHL